MSYESQSAYATANANTDVVVTLTGVSAAVAPGASSRHAIQRIIWSLTADPAAAITVNIESPVNTVISSFDILKGGPDSMDFGAKGLACALGSNTKITMDLAANTGATGKLTVVYEYV